MKKNKWKMSDDKNLLSFCEMKGLRYNCDWKIPRIFTYNKDYSGIIIEVLGPHPGSKVIQQEGRKYEFNILQHPDFVGKKNCIGTLDNIADILHGERTFVLDLTSVTYVC